MSTNVVINSNVDVVELHSNTDLTLESNTQIMFSTNNILINYIPFDEYIRKVVFDTEITTNLNSSDVHSWENAVDVPTPNNKINLTNNTSELIVDELHCSGISATHSHVNSKYHYINLSAAHNIYIKNNQNSTNVVYNKVDNQQLYSLSNYIYNVINTPLSPTADALTPESLTIPSPSGRTNISSLGMYIGNRIVTSNISTTMVMDGSDNEPVLEFDSQTAVNFVTNVFNTPGDVNAGSNIFFGSSSSGVTLDELVKSQLDETGLLNFTVNLTSGQTIGMEITGFTNSGGIRYDSFEYDVTFNIYDHPTGTTLDLSTATQHDFVQNTTLSLPFTTPIQTFTLGSSTYPLQAGRFYTVVATFTNTRTGTVVENVILEPRSVPTIEFITDLSAEVVDEDRLRVSFNNHATVVSGVTVNFNVIIRWNSFEFRFDSGISQYLNGSIQKTVDIPVNQITGYETNVLDNTAYEFQIETTGPFTILNDLIVSISHDFIDPNTPTDLTFNGTSFTWSHTSQSKITNVYYDVYKSTTLIGTTYVNTESFTASPTIISSFNLNSQRNTLNGLIPDTYKVKARHAYGSSSYATLTVNALSITTPSLSLSYNKKIYLFYNVSYNNGSYSISSNKSLSNNLYFTVSNPSSSQESHSVWVQVKDSFGLQMRSSDASITVYRPTIILGSLLYVTGSTREYTSSVSITGNTTTIRSISYATLVGMTFVSKTRSEIIFQLNNTDQNSIAVSANITVEDEYGFQNTIELSETINIAYNTEISTTPSYNTGTRVLSFQTSGLTYKWYKDNVIMNDEKGQTITISNQNFGIIHCVATETLSNGFTRYIQGDDFDNQEPTISGGSFTGINLLTYTPIVTAAPTVSNGTLVNYIISPSAFNITNLTHTLSANYKNPADIVVNIVINDTFTIILPSSPQITRAINVTYDSMTIIYNLGDNGNLLELTSAVLYYGKTTLFGSTISLNTLTSSVNVSSLDYSSTYYFKIEKTYHTYGTFESSNFSNATSTPPIPDAPTITLVNVSSTMIYIEWDQGGNSVYSFNNPPYSITINQYDPYINNVSQTIDIITNDQLTGNSAIIGKSGPTDIYTLGSLTPNTKYKFNLIKNLTYGNRSTGLYPSAGNYIITNNIPSPPVISLYSNTISSATILWNNIDWNGPDAPTPPSSSQVKVYYKNQTQNYTYSLIPTHIYSHQFSINNLNPYNFDYTYEIYITARYFDSVGVNGYQAYGEVPSNTIVYNLRIQSIAKSHSVKYISAKESKVLIVANDGTVYVYNMDSTDILGSLLYTIPKPSGISYTSWAQAVDINGSMIYIGDMWDDTTHNNAGIIYVYNGQTYNESIEYDYSGNNGTEFGRAFSVYNNNLLIANITSSVNSYKPFRFAMLKKIAGSWVQQNDLDLNTFYSIPYYTNINLYNMRHFEFYLKNSILIYNPNTIYITCQTLRQGYSTVYEIIKINLDSSFNGNNSITNSALTVYPQDDANASNIAPFYDVTYMNYQNANYNNTIQILNGTNSGLHTISYTRNGTTKSITFPELVYTFSALSRTQVFINNYLVIVQKSGNQLYYYDTSLP
jgi:hypothetical protein